MRRRRLALGMLRVGECRRRVMLGLQCSEPRSRVLLRLQMRFGTDDRGLSGVIFGRTAACRPGGGGRHDGLAGIAHLLHGRPHLAAKQTGNSDKNNNEPQHRVARH